MFEEPSADYADYADFFRNSLIAYLSQRNLRNRRNLRILLLWKIRPTLTFSNLDVFIDRYVGELIDLATGPFDLNTIDL